MPNRGTERRGAAGERAQCGGRKRDGSACGAFALASGLCVSHDPAHRKKLKAARVKGAVASNKIRVIQGQRRRLSTVSELVAYLSGVIQDVASGAVSVDIGRTITYAVSVQLRLIEGSDVVRRIEALEAAQQTEGSPTKWHA